MSSSDNPLLDFLLEMGFDRKKAERALQRTGNASVERAMEWILAHPDEEEEESSLPGSAPEGDSGTVKLNLSPEELAEQARKLEERRVQRRAEIAEKERLAAIEQEKTRRLTGKEIQDVRDKVQQAQTAQYVAERKREKEDDKRARQRVLDQIAEDRAKKEAEKNAARDKQADSAATAAATTASQMSLSAAASASFPTPTAGSHSETRIQIRMMDGSPLTQKFGAHESLGAVRLFAQLNRKDGDTSPFGLMSTFPRRDYTDEDMNAPLSALGLVPSATLIAKRQ